MNRYLTTLATAFVFTLPAATTETSFFSPAHRLPGVGIAREVMTGRTLDARAEAMIQSQTFSIMREPQAVAGAARIYSPSLQRLFHDAERQSGFPSSTLEAIAYLESWGIPDATSPAGPRGILQISEATGRRIGLHVVYATRHRTVKTKVETRNKHGKVVYKTLRRKETYTVQVRDDRLKPDKAIPAAAMYLAGMERKYGGRDWAIWAYHCGEGCINDFEELARTATGLGTAPFSVARVFFGCTPAWNRMLCDAIHTQMERDYSPTYWFRVMRAEQLLRMYQEAPPEFQDLAADFKNPTTPAVRAPDRLSVWLKPQDLTVHSSDHPRELDGLVVSPDDPAFFGYRLDMHAAATDGQDWRGRALPSTIGTLMYIAFETRRLLEQLRPTEPFVPLDVTALVVPKDEVDSMDGVAGARVVDHSNGQVFDLALSALPSAERECLQFVLDDLGWNGSLGFIEEPPGRQTLHIGCSPSTRDFFAQVYEEAASVWRNGGQPPLPAPPASTPATPPLPGVPPVGTA